MTDDQYLQVLHLLQAARAEVFECVQTVKTEIVLYDRLNGLYRYIHSVSKLVADARHKQNLVTEVDSFLDQVFFPEVHK